MAACEESNSNAECKSDESPFKATLLWKKLIVNLKTKVNKQSRSECVFSGKTAVDIIFATLRAERNDESSSLITKKITRCTAVKVCQAFLDGKVFLPLPTSKSQESTTLYDDDSTLYYFLDEKEEVLLSPSRKVEPVASTKPNLGLFLSLNSPSSFYNLIKNKKTTFNEAPSLVGCKKISSSDIKQEFSQDDIDVEMAEKEIAFRHLLRVLELPFLEQLIPSTETVQARFRIDMKMLDEYVSSTPETWVSMVKHLTGSSCFYYDNPVGMSCSQIKRQEYLKLRQHFRDENSAIVPVCYNDIFVELCGLVKRKLFVEALRAVQLAVLVLPRQIRHFLQLLFKFLDLIAGDDTCRLEGDVDNGQLVVDHFHSVIFKFEKSVATVAEVVSLTRFLLLNWKVVFTVPDFIKKDILDYRLHHKIMIADFEFCERIPEEIYTDRALEQCNSSLEQLLESIMDSTKISLNQKRKYLKKFKKHHPKIYHDKFKK